MVGVGGPWQKACVAGGEHAWQGGMCGRGRAWQGGHAWQGACMAGETATAADGTHPPGMHSCLKYIFGTKIANVVNENPQPQKLVFSPWNLVIDIFNQVVRYVGSVCSCLPVFNKILV